MGQTSTENLSTLVSPGTETPANNPPEHSRTLPDRPLFVLEQSSAWKPIDLREIWAARELVYFLVWRDIKVRYKQTALGVLWVVLQPLIMIAIFTICFGRLAGMDRQTSHIPYPVFAFAGLLLWNFFANALTTSSNSLIANTTLITKIYFPRSLLPVAAVISGLADFIVASLLFVGMALYYRVPATRNLLVAPAIVLGVMFLAIGLGLIFSAVNVKYRDIRQALPFLIQVWMFASPVIYPTAIVPARWRWILTLNPMTGFIETFRAAVFAHKPIDWGIFGLSATITLLALLSGSFFFRRMEKGFADII